MTTDRRRFLPVLAGASAYLLGSIALLGLGLWSSLGPADQAALTGMVRAQGGFLGLAAGLLIGGLALLLRAVWSRTVLPARRLAAEVRQLRADPSTARAVLAGPEELKAIARGVNALADRVVSGEQAVNDRVAAEAANLEQERNRLAALMTQLRVGVLMCTSDGRITLYNSAARQVLGGTERVGLGRSVFGILDRSLIVHARHRIWAGSAAFHEAMTAQDGKLLRVQVSLVAGEENSSAGFILLVEDLTRRLEADQRRSELLRALTEGSRASVASIRAAVENLRDFPQMGAEQRDRFIGVILEEALELSGHLEQTVSRYAGPEDGWFLAEMQGPDLVGSLVRAFAADPEMQVTVTDPGAELWIKVDSHALVRALAGFARRLCAERAVRELSLSLQAISGWAQLDARWPGVALDGSSLRDWTGEHHPDTAGPADAESLSAVVDRHGGELWSGTDEAGAAYVRLLLPMAETVSPPTPASTPVAAEVAAPAYDFDLFTLTAPTSALDDRRLDELTYTVFDTETTGLDPQGGDEIISVGAVRIVNGRLLRQETFERLVDPGRSVPPAAVRIHGITPGMLEGQPPIEAVLPDFARFAEDTVLVGHNVAFDLAFFRLKEVRSGVAFDQPVLDTLLLSAVVHPDHEGHSLEAIAARLGVHVIGRHTALGDAFVTGELFLRMLRMLLDQGVTTLGEAREASRRTYQARVTDSLYTPELPAATG